VTRVTQAGYRAYINSPQWKAKADAMRFAVEECEMCDDPPGTGLEVHHVTYEWLGEETPADLLVLCGRCHSRLSRMNDGSRQLQEEWALTSRPARGFYALANNAYPGFWAKVLRTGTVKHLRDGREMRKTGWGGL
jgi:hypothetical protein